MKWKKFLKPDWRKIILTFIFMIIFFPGYPPYYRGGGFPFSYLSSGSCPVGNNVVSCAIKENPINLIFDIIIWYIISCLIVWFFDKFRKK